VVVNVIFGSFEDNCVLVGELLFSPVIEKTKFDLELEERVICLVDAGSNSLLRQQDLLFAF
jgi:hypothetical protein